MKRIAAIGAVGAVKKCKKSLTALPGVLTYTESSALSLLVKSMNFVADISVNASGANSEAVSAMAPIVSRSSPTSYLLALSSTSRH
jgi:hypothetical protein